MPPAKPMHSEFIKQTKQIVEERMRDQQAGHGFDHVVRVLRLTREIQAELGGDRLVAELAALLHDIGDAKFHNGKELSATFARQILEGLAVPEEIINAVADIVDNISFRKGYDASKLSLEGKIVQDADRLDALGAIGIVRTIEYGCAFGQPFYPPDSNSDEAGTGTTGIDLTGTGVGHFHEKLFKLCGLMNTDPAKRIAAAREKFMRTFLEQFLLEWGANEAAIDGEVLR